MLFITIAASCPVRNCRFAIEFCKRKSAFSDVFVCWALKKLLHIWLFLIAHCIEEAQAVLTFVIRTDL